MNMHGRAAAMVTPIGDKNTLLPAESAVSSSGCAGRGRVKRAARERTNGSTRGCRERSDAKVCASASVAEGPSATSQTSRGVHLGISAHLEMGRRPMHVYTLTLKCTPRGHPKLSLGYFVTVCNRHSTLVHQGCFTFSDNDSWSAPDHLRARK